MSVDTSVGLAATADIAASFQSSGERTDAISAIASSSTGSYACTADVVNGTDGFSADGTRRERFESLAACKDVPALEADQARPSFANDAALHIHYLR